MDDLVKIASYSIDRGRTFELDRCDVGRASLTIYDLDGTLDPTNSSGTFYNYINPLKQARLALWNPVLEDWYSRFRGFVESWEYEFDPTQQFNKLTVNLIDLFEIIAAVEMFPGYFGHACPPEHAGNVFFEDTADGDVHGMQTRINHILSGSVSAPVTLGDCGIDPTWYTALSGNVSLHESTYAPGSSAMEAIQEAADAEFPGVANVFCDRTGQLLALGRFSRFDPVGTAAATAWDFQDWKAGDGAAVAASPSDTAHLRAFSMSRDLQKIINFAQASPITNLDGATFDTRLQANTVQNPTSKGLYGIRSWSVDNLITKEGVTDGDVLPGPHVDWDEVRRYADYYVRNYHTPANRVTQIKFRSMDPDWPGAAALWDFMCRSDISDRVALTIGSPGGGGLTAHKYYVEGIHQEVTHLRGDYDDVTLTLDLSPDDYFQDSPFST
jgi:hypothetical protein